LTEGAGNQQSPTFPPKSSHEACLVLVLLVFIRLLWLRTLVASPTNQILEFFHLEPKKTQGVEGSMGWLWATVETFVELVLLTVLITVTGKAAKSPGCKSRKDFRERQQTCWLA